MVGKERESRMIFDQNRDKKPQFAKGFNDLAFRPKFDEAAFFKLAEENGYTEARVMAAGTGAAFQRDVGEKRITAQIDESGKLRRYLFG